MIIVVQQSPAVTLPPVTLFLQLCYFELGPKKFELSYFPHSYAIFPPSYAIFLFFPPVTLPPMFQRCNWGAKVELIWELTLHALLFFIIFKLPVPKVSHIRCFCSIQVYFGSVKDTLFFLQPNNALCLGWFLKLGQKLSSGSKESLGTIIYLL